MDEISKRIDESLNGLADDDKARVDEIKKQIDTNDPDAVSRFGVDVQSKISDFAEKVLAEVKARDTGHAGKALTDLMTRLREMRLDSLSGRPAGFFSKIPFIGSLVDGTRQFMTRYQSVSVQIVKIVEELEQARARLLQDVGVLEAFYENNLAYFRKIGLHILAGESMLRELEERILPGMKAGAEASRDAFEIQKYQDMVRLAERLEKKLHDLKLSRTVSLQAGPQIRLVQNNNRELAEKIQSSILNTIPLWKHQMVLAITLLRQSQILGVQREVAETTRELLEKNADMLKVSSLEIAKEAEKGVVDVETLKKVNANLIGTIEETLKLQQEGRIRRQQAEQEIGKLEQELRTRLVEIRDARAQGRDTA